MGVGRGGGCGGAVVAELLAPIQISYHRDVY